MICTQKILTDWSTQPVPHGTPRQRTKWPLYPLHTHFFPQTQDNEKQWWKFLPVGISVTPPLHLLLACLENLHLRPDPLSSWKWESLILVPWQWYRITTKACSCSPQVGTLRATVKNYPCFWLKSGYPGCGAGCTTELGVVDKLAEGVINATTSHIWWIAAKPVP